MNFSQQAPLGRIVPMTINQKLAAQRIKERIVPTEIPVRNSTMGGTYDGSELSYRGSSTSA